MPRRVVQIYIVDPDENIPLDKALLYHGPEKLTDLSDQELFFEIDIRKVLEEHNKFRETVINKTIKDRTEHLEPTRVGKLKMVVVTVAQF